MKTAKGWKTVAYGVLIGLLGLLTNEDMAAFLAEHVKWIGPLIGTGVVVLRAVTSSPVFEKEPDKNFGDSE